MSTEEAEQFTQTLRQIAIELENLWIEKEMYLDLLVFSGIATPELLKQDVEKRLADPNVRKRVHEDFSEMWAALEKSGRPAFFKALLEDLPPSEKPN